MRNKRLIASKQLCQNFFSVLVMSKDSGNEHLAFVPVSINFKGLQFLVPLTLSVSKSETDLALLESSLNSFDLINLDIKEVSNLLISG